MNGWDFFVLAGLVGCVLFVLREEIESARYYERFEIKD
jgi:hypothetical protein